MEWTDLHRLAASARCDLLLLDSCLGALARSRNAALHAQVAAEVPNAETLCMALDAHRIPVPPEVEAQIVMRHRFVEFVAPPASPLPHRAAAAA